MSETIKNVFWYGVYGVCALLLFVVGTYYSLLISSWNELETEIKKARDRGDLMTFTEMEDAYNQRVSSTKEYSNDFYRTDKHYDCLANDLPKKWKDIENLRYPSELKDKFKNEWDQETRQDKLQKLLQFTEQYQDEIDQLLSKRYPPEEINFSKGPKTIQIDLYDRSRFVETYAFIHLYSGHYDKVMRALKWCFENANIRFKEPKTSSFLYGLILRWWAIRFVSELLQIDRVPPEILVDIKRMIHDHPNLKSVFIDRFQEGFSSNFWWMHGLLTNNKEVLKHADEKNIPFRLARPWIFQSMTNGLRDFHQWRKLFRQPYRRVKSKMERHISKIKKNSLPYYPDSYSFQDVLDAIYRSNITNIMFIDPLRTWKSVNQHQAKVGLLSTAIDTKIHLLKHGAPPDPLDSVIDRTDPFTGDPYRVHQHKNHIVFFSPGRNLTFDGEKKTKPYDESDDIVVKVPVE